MDRGRNKLNRSKTDKRSKYTGLGSISEENNGDGAEMAVYTNRHAQNVENSTYLDGLL